MRNADRRKRAARNDQTVRADGPIERHTQIVGRFCIVRVPQKNLGHRVTQGNRLATTAQPQRMQSVQCTSAMDPRLSRFNRDEARVHQPDNTLAVAIKVYLALTLSCAESAKTAGARSRTSSRERVRPKDVDGRVDRNIGSRVHDGSLEVILGGLPALRPPRRAQLSSESWWSWNKMGGSHVFVGGTVYAVKAARFCLITSTVLVG